MPDAIEVARHLIFLAAQESEPDSLSPLRLQKLLYYVQGWSLGLRGREMFPEDLEAWVHGPVVPSVYSRFKEFGYDLIPAVEGLQAELTKDDAEFVEAVWQVYRVYSATSLREMSHREAPWKKARGGRRPEEACGEVISKTSMREFFAEAAKRKKK